MQTNHLLKMAIALLTTCCMTWAISSCAKEKTPEEVKDPFDQTTFHMTGTVTDLDGNAMKGVKVVVANTDSTVTTDTTGEYILSTPKEGEHTILFTLSEHIETSVKLTIPPQTPNHTIYTINTKMERRNPPVTITEQGGEISDTKRNTSSITISPGTFSEPQTISVTSYKEPTDLSNATSIEEKGAALDIIEIISSVALDKPIEVTFNKATSANISYPGTTLWSKTDKEWHELAPLSFDPTTNRYKGTVICSATKAVQFSYNLTARYHSQIINMGETTKRTEIARFDNSTNMSAKRYELSIKTAIPTMSDVILQQGGDISYDDRQELLQIGTDNALNLLGGSVGKAQTFTQPLTLSGYETTIIYQETVTRTNKLLIDFQNGQTPGQIIIEVTIPIRSSIVTEKRKLHPTN